MDSVAPRFAVGDEAYDESHDLFKVTKVHFKGEAIGVARQYLNLEIAATPSEPARQIRKRDAADYRTWEEELDFLLTQRKGIGGPKLDLLKKPEILESLVWLAGKEFIKDNIRRLILVLLKRKYPMHYPWFEHQLKNVGINPATLRNF